MVLPLVPVMPVSPQALVRLAVEIARRQRQRLPAVLHLDPGGGEEDPAPGPGASDSLATATAPRASASCANWRPSARLPGKAKNRKSRPTRRESYSRPSIVHAGKLRRERLLQPHAREYLAQVICANWTRMRSPSMQNCARRRRLHAGHAAAVRQHRQTLGRRLRQHRPHGLASEIRALSGQGFGFAAPPASSSSPSSRIFGLVRSATSATSRPRSAVRGLPAFGRRSCVRQVLGHVQHAQRLGGHCVEHRRRRRAAESRRRRACRSASPPPR